MAEDMTPVEGQQQSVQVVLDERDMKTNFANGYRIHTTAEEVIVDFGFNLLNPNPQGGQQQMLFKVTDRIILSYPSVKRLSGSLRQLILRYEQQFGEIPITDPARPGRDRHDSDGPAIPCPLTSSASQRKCITKPSSSIRRQASSRWYARWARIRSAPIGMIPQLLRFEGRGDRSEKRRRLQVSRRPPSARLAVASSASPQPSGSIACEASAGSIRCEAGRPGHAHPDQKSPGPVCRA